MKNIIKKISIAFLFLTVFVVPSSVFADYNTYDDSYYTNYSYDDSYYTNYSYDDSYYTNYNYDDSYYTNYSYDDSYYTNYSYDDSYYTNYTYETPYIYENPIVYQTPYIYEAPIVYETPYIYENPIVYQTPYYNEPSYNQYPTYVTYDPTYYGGSGCYTDCYDDYEPECRTNCNPPRYDDLDVICIVSDRTIEEGESVTFEADVDGGKGPYTYRWTGDFTSNNRSVYVQFDNEGTYEGTVRVTDSRGRTATANCDVTVEEDEEDEEDEDFDAICVQSDRTIEEGERVTFTARVEGGDRPYDYDWSGDANGNDREITVRFNREGRYEIDLEVTDDEGRTARDTCEIRVKDEDNNDDDDDDRDVNVTTGTYTSGGGNLASVGSVYLNQVPYTGPEDVAKGVAFAGILLAWSAAGALLIRKRMIKNDISKRIANFKEANKLAQI